MPNGQGAPPSQNATEENTYYYTRLGKMMILVVSKRVRQVPPILASRSLVSLNDANQMIHSAENEVTHTQICYCGTLRRPLGDIKRFQPVQRPS